MYTGRVVGGQVVVDGDPLPEGITVTIYYEAADEADDAEEFCLSPEQLAQLDEAIAQANRGEGIPAAIALDELDEIVRGATSK